MIDIGMLISMAQPDANGNLIPNYIQEGSVVFSNPKGRAQWMTLAVCGAFYNPRKATCGEYWVDCYGYSNPQALADPFSVAVNGAVQLHAKATYSDGTVDDFTSSSSWTSSSTPVATVGASTGLVSGVSGGTVSISAEFPLLVTYTGELCSEGGPLPCPVAYLGGGSSGSVPPNITSISPSMGLIGASTTVTLSGSGFGDSQGSSTVNAGTGTTLSYSSWSDTQIGATFQVASNAPSGNHSVTVTTAVATSNSVNFYVQIPTSLSIVKGTNSLTSEATCTTGGSTGCGVTRSFTYQVNDQEVPPQPITGSGIASLQFWDAIQTTSPNALGLTGYTTTCTPSNTGPCGQYVNSSGQFGEKSLGACSTACISNGACVTGGPTNANQTWYIGSFSIVQQLSYYCSKVLVNGQ